MEWPFIYVVTTFSTWWDKTEPIRRKEFKSQAAARRYFNRVRAEEEAFDLYEFSMLTEECIHD